LEIEAAMRFQHHKQTKGQEVDFEPWMSQPKQFST
jgi:hypothetical protein